MKILMINLPATNLLKIWRTCLWRILHEIPQAEVGILDLLLESAGTPIPPIDIIKERIDWRFKSELDCANINGKQKRWLRKWISEKRFDIALYGEYDIDTHLIRSVIDIGNPMCLQHIVLPTVNDCDFLTQACEAALQHKTGGN